MRGVRELSCPMVNYGLVHGIDDGSLDLWMGDVL